MKYDPNKLINWICKHCHRFNLIERTNCRFCGTERNGDKTVKKVITTSLLALALLNSCRVGCEAEKVVVNSLPKEIANVLQCQNVAAIQSDVKAIIDKTSVCPSGKQGPIASLVCPLVAEGAVSLLGSQIPESWQCNPQLASKGLVAAITAGCNVLPF